MVLVEKRRRVSAKTAAPSSQTDLSSNLKSSEPSSEHVPVPVGVLGPIEFNRCPCGFTLAKYDGRLFWIRATPGIREIHNADELAQALRTRCWHYRRKNKSSGKAPTSVAPSNSHAIRTR
jgi:hypothetical protein